MARHILQDKHVVITGASDGIGKALVLDVARRGANVTLAARSVAKLDAVAEEVRKLGRQALVVRTDVTSPDQCAELVALAIAGLGEIDVLICNAGGSASVSEGEVVSRLDMIRRVMDLNFMGAVATTLAALPSLRNTRGLIVGVSSLQGLLPFVGSSAYAAAKHAMQGFYDCLRLDLQGAIDVLVVSPGPVATAIHAGSGLSAAQLTARAMPVDKCASIIRRAIETGRRDVIMTWRLGLAARIYPFARNSIDRWIVRETKRFYAQD